MNNSKLPMFSSIKMFCTAFVLIASGIFSLNTIAQDEELEFNVETITCWDVMLLDEEERSYAFILLFGYHAGKSNSASVMSGETIEASLNKALIYCEENPDNPAIWSMAI